MEKPDEKGGCTLDEAKTAACIEALRRHKGNVTHAARELGITPRGLQKRIPVAVRTALRTCANSASH